MTGPEFAAAHDNDSTRWTTADIETEINLAEIDAYQQTTTPTDYQPAA